MQDFLTDLGNKQRELLTAFLFDIFSVPATRKGLSTLTTSQRMFDHSWQGYKVVSHGNGIRFQHQTSSELVDFDFGINLMPIYSNICPYRAWGYFNSLSEANRSKYDVTQVEADFVSAVETELERQSELFLLDLETVTNQPRSPLPEPIKFD